MEFSEIGERERILHKDSMFVTKLIAVVFALVCFLYGFRTLQKHRRRDMLRQRQFPSQWGEIMRRNVPITISLPTELHTELKQRVQIFLDEKEIRGCQGLEITDEMRVTIAAQACLLLLNKPMDTYAGLYTVLVYPEAFRSHQKTLSELGMVVEKEEIRTGESWTGGHVVLSWKHTKEGGRKQFDGHNVVIHEFAHQLDQMDGYADGLVAPLENPETWIHTFQERYRQIKAQWNKKGKKPFLRAYGVTNPAEFFAVSSELFFECPKRFRAEYPDIYQELSGFYKLDPCSWV